MEKYSQTELEQATKKQKAKSITFRFILALVLFLVTLYVFVSITDEIVLEHENGFDQNISQAILSFVSPFATRLMETITFFGSSYFLFPAYLVIIIYYLFRKNMKMALDITMVGLSSTGVLYLFKEIFKRHRPLDPLMRNVTGFSFPSGHSFSSFTFCGLLIYILWETDIKKAWKILLTIILFLFAATIAFSRVYLRVHYPSDVVAGFCLSMCWLMLSLWILHKADKKPFKSARV
ncbi:MAG: phosphatase PAP2 family protein [Ginsengibacter sp.]